MTLPPTLGEVFNSGVVHSGILFTSGHSAPAALAAGRLRAFFAEIIPRGVYSSKTFIYKEVKITIDNQGASPRLGLQLNL